MFNAMSTMLGDSQDLELAVGPRCMRTQTVDCAQPASGFEVSCLRYLHVWKKFLVMFSKINQRGLRAESSRGELSPTSSVVTS